MEKIECAARGLKIFQDECRPNQNHNACRKCDQFVEKSPETEFNPMPTKMMSHQNVPEKQMRREAPRRTSAQIIELKHGIKVNSKKIDSLYKKISPWPCIEPEHHRGRKKFRPRKVRKLKRELDKLLGAQAYRRDRLLFERAQLVREDYHKLIVKAKSHWDPNPFKPAVNYALLKLIDINPDILKEDWVILKVISAIKNGNALFQKELGRIVTKPPNWKDGRGNYLLSDCIESLRVNQPGITFEDVYSIVQDKFPNLCYTESDLRRVCNEWGFEFEPGKRGGDRKSSNWRSR